MGPEEIERKLSDNIQSILMQKYGQDAIEHFNGQDSIRTLCILLAKLLVENSVKTNDNILSDLVSGIMTKIKHSHHGERISISDIPEYSDNNDELYSTDGISAFENGIAIAEIILNNNIENNQSDTPPQPQGDGTDDPDNPEELGEDKGTVPHETMAQKIEKALKIAKVIIPQYTLSNTTTGKEQVAQAIQAVQKILYAKEGSNVFPDQAQSKEDQDNSIKMTDDIRTALIYGSTGENSPLTRIGAIKTILDKFTNAASHIEIDTGKSSPDPLNGSHIRVVKDKETVNGVLVPASLVAAKDKIIWGPTLIEEISTPDMPILYADSEEMQLLLSKDAKLYQRTTAMCRIKAQVSKNSPKINWTKLYNIIKHYAVSDHAPAALSPLRFDTTANPDSTKEFLETASGDKQFKFTALPLRKPKNTGDPTINLTIDFISLFYNMLSPLSGAATYIRKSNGAYESIDEIKMDIDTDGYPKIILLAPKPIKFTKVDVISWGSVFTRLTGGDTMDLVQTTIDGHNVIIVLKKQYAQALFSIY